MKNGVFMSLENSQGDHCVDIFVRPDGSFGFEEFRRDIEDCGAWHTLNRYSSMVFESEERAVSTARKYVTWLSST